MPSFEDLLAHHEDFGIHCETREDASALIEYIYVTYPHKRNENFDMFSVWDHNQEDTIIYPNFWNCNKVNFGRVGGPASFRRKVYEFCELELRPELPIEQSDMDIFSMLGL